MNGIEIDETEAIKFAANAAWDKLPKAAQDSAYGKAAIAAWDARNYERAAALVLLVQTVHAAA